jgi:chromosome segregation protein
MKRSFSRKHRTKKLKGEIEELEQASAKLKDTMVTNERQFREGHEQLESMAKEVAERERSYNDAEQQLQTVRKEENDALISSAQLKGELRAKEELVKMREREQESINEKSALNSERIHSCNEESVRIAQEKATLERDRSELAAHHESIRTSLKDHFEKKSSIAEKTDALKAALGEITDKEKHLFESISGINLEKVRIETRSANLSEKIREEFGVELSKFETPDATLPRERITEELEILEERMRTFGAVNLMAEEDLARIEKRKDDLITQKTDLQEAQKDLLKTIEHIDSIAKEKFLETFNGVRDNFRTLFMKLFESGECDLTLSGDDPLEADIVIKAQPKHKKVTRLESLSTGERTLIAISLLFAFYLVKPSPICVLDEIDAPLDDANIKRFIALLQDFKKRSQLIVITHNKLTMESADYLYGITMTEPNVSTVASVKIS